MSEKSQIYQIEGWNHVDVHGLWFRFLGLEKKSEKKFVLHYQNVDYIELYGPQEARLRICVWNCLRTLVRAVSESNGGFPGRIVLKGDYAEITLK